MKKITSIIATLFALLSMSALPVLVRAETSTDPDTSVSSTTTTQTEPDTATTARATRVAAYKKAHAERVSAAAKTRLEARCEAAQAILKVRQTNVATAISNHSEAYDHIVKVLEATAAKLTAAKLTAASADLATLTEDIAELKVKVATFNTDAATLTESLSDTVALDCVADPVAFRASLLATRTNQLAVVKDARAIRTYLTGTVKADLLELKKSTATSATEAVQ